MAGGRWRRPSMPAEAPKKMKAPLTKSEAAVEQAPAAGMEPGEGVKTRKQAQHKMGTV